MVLKRGWVCLECDEFPVPTAVSEIWPSIPVYVGSIPKEHNLWKKNMA